MPISFREVFLLVVVLTLPFLVEGPLVHEGVLFSNAWVEHSIEVFLISPLDVKRRVASLHILVDLIDPPVKVLTGVVLLLWSVCDVDVLNLSLDVIEVILEIFLEDYTDLLELLPVINRVELEGREQDC